MSTTVSPQVKNFRCGSLIRARESVAILGVGMSRFKALRELSLIHIK